MPPFYENFGKRLVKSPKLYFVDSGLACHLLGIESEAGLRRSPFLDPLFEGFVASEIVKAQLNCGRRRGIYYFRDHQGLEVDLVVPAGGHALAVIEVKASRSVTPAMAEPLARLTRAVRGYDVRSFLVHAGASGDAASAAVRPGVRAVAANRLVAALGLTAESRR